MRLVADVWVAGLPATKGSVNVNRGGTGVRQAARGYAAWSDGVRRALAAENGRATLTFGQDVTVRPLVQRHEGAMVRCRFWVPQPPTADAYGGVWAPQVGDGDKLERAVWDAVTKAGLWQDDAQVVEWAGSRRWADSAYRSPGVHIAIWALLPHEIDADHAPLRDSAVAYHRAMFPEPSS